MRRYSGFFDSWMDERDGFILTIGNFDGFHTGHRRILSTLRSIADESGWRTGGITFTKKPAAFFAESYTNTQVIPLGDKIARFADEGFSFLFVLPFERKFVSLGPEEFCELLAKNSAFRAIVVGEDFRFGRGRSGDISLLRELLEPKGIRVVPVPVVYDDGVLISSSLIRQSIRNGDMSVNKYLSIPFYIRGCVEFGKRIGRTISYPTANVYVYDQVQPREGVYFTITGIDARVFFSMTFVGEGGVIETHLLNFDEDIYRRDITIHFLAYFRPNRKIGSLDELRELLNRDREYIMTTYCAGTTPEKYVQKILEERYDG